MEVWSVLSGQEGLAAIRDSNVFLLNKSNYYGNHQYKFPTNIKIKTIKFVSFSFFCPT